MCFISAHIKKHFTWLNIKRLKQFSNQFEVKQTPQNCRITHLATGKTIFQLPSTVYKLLIIKDKWLLNMDNKDYMKM